MLVSSYNRFQTTKKLIAAQCLVNIIDLIVNSLSPVLLYIQERLYSIAEVFLHSCHNRLDTSDQICYHFFSHSDLFPVFFQEPYHSLVFRADLFNR